VLTSDENLNNYGEDLVFILPYPIPDDTCAIMVFILTPKGWVLFQHIDINPSIDKRWSALNIIWIANALDLGIWRKAVKGCTSDWKKSKWIPLLEEVLKWLDNGKRIANKLGIFLGQ